MVVDGGGGVEVEWMRWGEMMDGGGVDGWSEDGWDGWGGDEWGGVEVEVVGGGDEWNGGWRWR